MKSREPLFTIDFFIRLMVLMCVGGFIGVCIALATDYRPVAWWELPMFVASGLINCWTLRFWRSTGLR